MGKGMGCVEGGERHGLCGRAGKGMGCVEGRGKAWAVWRVGKGTDCVKGGECVGVGVGVGGGDWGWGGGARDAWSGGLCEHCEGRGELEPVTRVGEAVAMFAGWDCTVRCLSDPCNL